MPENLFSNSPSEQLYELVDVENNYSAASDLIAKNPDMFLKNPNQDQEILKHLAAGLNKDWDPRLANAAQTLAEITRDTKWDEARVSIKAAQNLADQYPRSGVLSSKLYPSANFTQLQSDLSEIQQRFKILAPAAFFAFNHYEAQSFFAVYPIEIDPPAFLKQIFLRFKTLLTAASEQQLKQFVINYSDSLFDSEIWQSLGGILYKNEMEEENSPSVLTRLTTTQRFIDLGFSIPQSTLTRIAFVEATSKNLLQDGQIDFPVGIETDLAADFTRLSLNEALDPEISAEYDLIIILDVILAKASRRVINMKNVPSTVFLGYGAMSSEEASSYIAQTVNDEDGLDAPTLPSMTGSGNNITSSTAPNSMTITENSALGAPIIYRYNFKKARIQARKLMSARYYIIDPKQATLFQSMFDVSQEERFEIAYSISRYDPKKKKFINQYDTEKDVNRYEKDTSNVKLSSLLIHAENSFEKTVPMVQAKDLRRELLESRNRVLANYKANDFDDRPLNDPRFDSVVAVYRGSGAMGSGFYVKPDVVLTNWHVVEDSRYVEMRMYDGQETYGHVLGKDVRLDLALIKVQNRGRPVAFYTNKNLDTGIPVEAIGHPHRKLFSITRGIVSATRYENSIFFPRGTGDKVFYIQTDAPINPGNSGGPLFYKNKVVGVNTWGYKKWLAEGLNFSVHYGEVLGFLNEHLPGFQTPITN